MAKTEIKFGTPDQEIPADLEPSTNGHRGATWRPVDLGPFLRGEYVRPQPTIGLTRDDGLQLLYPGCEHVVFGEMESGKSWFAVACVAAELTRGNSVVYIHFEEADPADTIERLRALGVPDDVIESEFVFVGPGEPVDPYALAALLTPYPAVDENFHPSLVVLDGVNEAMSMNRLNPREEDAVAVFRAKLVKPCTAVGAAVLACDHVVKDRDRRDRTALGSIHKGNAVGGSMIYMENVAPFGRGERGCSHLYVTKDRPGFLRRNGRPSRKTPGVTYMGSLIVDDTRLRYDRLEMAFVLPEEQPADDADESNGQTRAQSDDDIVYATVVELVRTGTQPVTRAIRATAGISKERVSDALTRLTISGRLTERTGPKRARIFGFPPVQQPISGESEEH